MWHHNHHLINAYQQILRWNINWFCCFLEIKLIKIVSNCGESFPRSHLYSLHSISTDSVAEGRYSNNSINSDTYNYKESSHVRDACRKSCMGSENKRRERVRQRMVSQDNYFKMLQLIIAFLFCRYMCQVRLIEYKCKISILVIMNFLSSDQYRSDEKSSRIFECCR